MRKKFEKQLPLNTGSINHPRAAELEIMSKILDTNPIILDLAHQDLSDQQRKETVGAEGMSVEQVLRAAVIKQMEVYSYEELAFHLLDSKTYRRFCRIGIADKGFGKSTLCAKSSGCKRRPGKQSTKHWLNMPNRRDKIF